MEKGAGNADQVIANFTNKEDLKVLGEDIRYIKLNDVKLQPKDNLLFGSLLYWLFYIVPAVVFIVFFIVYRNRLPRMQCSKMRTKKPIKWLLNE